MRFKNAISVVFLIPIFISCSQKTIPSGNVNFLYGNEGTVMVRAIGLGSSQEEAVADAEKNAMNVLLFRGLPESEQKLPLISTNEAEVLDKHKQYFNSFYTEKRYKTFVMSAIPCSNLRKSKASKRSFAADIKINLIALRRDLEQNNLIRKFGL